MKKQIMIFNNKINKKVRMIKYRMNKKILFHKKKNIKKSQNNPMNSQEI